MDWGLHAEGQQGSHEKTLAIVWLRNDQGLTEAERVGIKGKEVLEAQSVGLRDWG